MIQLSLRILISCKTPIAEQQLTDAARRLFELEPDMGKRQARAVKATCEFPRALMPGREREQQ